jgi:hypothetical protein
MSHRKNFAISTVATAPSPATSGTSLVVASGEGANFPVAPFPVIIWPTGVRPTVTNAEIGMCIDRSSDTMTITRAQEGSPARTVVVGDQIMYGFTEAGFDSVDQMEEIFTRYGVWRAVGNSTAVPGSFGIAALTFVGTPVARNFATTNWLTRQARVNYPSASTTGSLCSWRFGGGIVSLGNGTLGGFRVRHVFMASDAATVAGARQFTGISTTTGAPTNVEPSTLLNCIGVGHGAADTNLKIYYGGSAAQTPIDLGANFPANTLSADIYEVEIWNLPGSTATTVVVRRFNTSGTLLFEATNVLGPGTAGVTMPLNNAALSPIWGYRTNNATALAVGMDLFSFLLDRFPLGQ